MTQMANAEAVPQWDVADRMRKALRTSDVGVQEIADYLGVARNTVSTWINGRIEPSKQTLRLWALRTGVSYDWLSGSRELTGTATLTSQEARAESQWTARPGIVIDFPTMRIPRRLLHTA